MRQLLSLPWAREASPASLRRHRSSLSFPGNITPFPAHLTMRFFAYLSAYLNFFFCLSQSFHMPPIRGKVSLTSFQFYAAFHFIPATRNFITHTVELDDESTGIFLPSLLPKDPRNTENGALDYRYPWGPRGRPLSWERSLKTFWPNQPLANSKSSQPVLIQAPTFPLTFLIPAEIMGYIYFITTCHVVACSYYFCHVLLHVSPRNTSTIPNIP